MFSSVKLEHNFLDKVDEFVKVSELVHRSKNLFLFAEKNSLFEL